MQRLAERRILLLAAAFTLLFSLVAGNYYRLSGRREYVRTAEDSSFITIHAGETQGTVFDRNMIPLTNAETSVVAVAVPSVVTFDELFSLAADTDGLCSSYIKGKPFAFRCIRRGEDSAGLTFFEIPVHSSADMPAPHVVGYLSENSGASGIEYAYDRILRSGNTDNCVTYRTDGFGNVLIGAGKDVVRSSKQETGAVTTLDSRIQRICEEAGKSIDKGAIVVTDVQTGEILALASFPRFDPDDISAALNDGRSPLIDRALYSYSVGSVFKLVTACEGINEGLGGYVYDCRGSINVSGQLFRCHKYDGHGVQTMSEAMTNSCNTYFISLSSLLDIPAFRNLASDLGFGRETYLCAGMTASAGVLPTVDELLVPAELANYSFGQGRLTATPLQINALTCAIANGGELPLLTIVRGITVDGKTVANEKPPRRSRVMEPETAAALRKMMTEAVYCNENSKSRPEFVRAAAKTSTAQTGRFDDDGEELCHAWITGFFPAREPEYAVTVLVEDGGYGNDAAAPVFAQIADGIIKKADTQKEIPSR